MYILSLEIENLRTLKKAQVHFNVPGGEALPGNSRDLPNISLLLGDNGSGKTSVLRAAALAALGPILTSGSGFVPYSLVRRNRDRGQAQAKIKAELLLHEQDGHAGKMAHETVIEPTRGWVDRFRTAAPPKWAEDMWDEKSPAFLMVGYGAGRRVDPNAVSEEQRSRSRALRYGRVAGLFEESVTMVPLSAWLPRFRTQDPSRHEEAIHLLNLLLQPHAELQPEPIDDEYLFSTGGVSLPFQALSDGYRAYVGWVADLLYHLCTGTPRGWELAENRGVVLVDEVDLHLHPEWQQRVIPTVAHALPNLQFIFTSHSPLLVGTVHGSNLFVLENGDIRPSDEEVYGLSSDQILTSGHFGLSSARDPEFTSRLETQALAAREGDSEAALHFMRLMALGAAAGEDPPPPTSVTTAQAPAPVAHKTTAIREQAGSSNSRKTRVAKQPRKK